MSRYVTVDRQSPESKKYLSGQFSRLEVALPVPILDGAQLSSTITFQILAPGEISKPNFAIVLLRLLRLDLLALTVLPTLIVWLLSDVQISTAEQWILLVSIFFLHGATFAFNDYFDHMQGRDHVNEKSGSRLIQNGFLRAHQVLKVAWAFWALAFGGGLYLAFFNPGILVFAAFGAALGAMGSMYQFFGLKSIGFSDVALVLALGPLLTLAVEYTLTQKTSQQFFVMGVVYGLLALVYSQGKNLASTMLDHQAGIRTVSVRLGFDKAKTFLMFELVAVVVLSLHIFKNDIGLFVLFVGSTGFVIDQLRKVKSPIASRAQDFPKQVLRLHNIFSFCFVLQALMQRFGL